VTALFEAATTPQRALPETHERAELGRRFVAAHFPDGPAGIVNLPYDEELVAVEDLLEALASATWADAVSRLGLTDYVTALQELLPDYRTEIERLPGDKLRYADVRDAFKQAQGALLEVVAAILGVLQTSPEATLTMLQPLLFQQELIGAALRANTRVADVDPDADGAPEAVAPPAG
jgi:hypothetical protein